MKIHDCVIGSRTGLRMMMFSAGVAFVVLAGAAAGEGGDPPAAGGYGRDRGGWLCAREARWLRKVYVMIGGKNKIEGYKCNRTS